MKCKRCNRELKNHVETGIGKVCQMKAQRLSEAVDRKIKIVPLFLRRIPRRSYLVMTQPRATVVVKDTQNGRFAECQNCAERCEHINLAAEMDNARFPQAEITEESGGLSGTSGIHSPQKYDGIYFKSREGEPEYEYLWDAASRTMAEAA